MKLGSVNLKRVLRVASNSSVAGLSGAAKERALVLVVVLALAVGAGYLVVSRDAERPSRDDVADAQSKLRLARTTVEERKTADRLPPLPSSWARVTSVAGGCGVELEPRNPTDTAAGDYEGLAPKWKGTLSGEAGMVVVCAMTLLRDLPVWPTSISITGEPLDRRGTFRFSVLGRLDNAS
ncbi:hypothetical protein JN531_016820 (plasmid) [Flagellatimonas centrodinii]|uniref:hypothetical protein n=1 Tax=Flagellatimonas centrodinii TaxID=2806210 RepID=UPI001FF8FE5F|nr:hypothetical protein [Flagellatimonas centrodinii]ULQ48441.1 hypothetical protein JN531_016820 [Flagellatimonas centrodinii]